MGETIAESQPISQMMANANLSIVSMVLAVTTCMIFLLYYYCKNAHMYALAAKLPGLPALPLIGNAHIFLGIDTLDFVKKLLDIKNKFGSEPQRFWLGPSLWVGLFNPADFEAILTSENAVNKNSVYNFFNHQSNGIFLASGNRWRALRKLVNPTFNMKLLEQFLEIFNKQSKILVEVLEQKADGELFDVHDYIARCTLDMICGSHMGVNTKEQIENKSNFAQNIYKSTEITLMRIYKVYFHLEFIFRLSSYYKQNLNYIKPLHKFMAEVIKERQEIRANSGDKGGAKDLDLDTGKKRTIFLDAIMDNHSEMNMKELVMSTMDMVVAGSDTTAVVISYCILMLAMNPDVQEKVFKEQCEIYQDLDSPTTLATINEMKYLDMVIKESLRLSTAIGVVRQITKDIDIENYTLPAGANLYLAFYGSHHDARYWKHPDKFYPEHFTKENVDSRPKYSYMPFSMGPRNCPGHVYGMLSMKSIISHFIRHYKFTTTLKMEDLKYVMSFLLETAQRYPIKLYKRSS